jgi:hypothetical protein
LKPVVQINGKICAKLAIYLLETGYVVVMP